MNRITKPENTGVSHPIIKRGFVAQEIELTPKQVSVFEEIADHLGISVPEAITLAVETHIEKQILEGNYTPSPKPSSASDEETAVSGLN